MVSMANEARAPDPRTPPPPPDPKRGNLRVSGTRDKPPMLPWSPRRFLLILAALFLVNWVLVQIFAPGEERIRVPYTPTFLAQLRDGNVKEISSTGETLQGEFKKEVGYDGERAELFKTEIPTFANEKQLADLLDEQKVVVNARSPSDRPILLDDPARLRTHDPAGGPVRVLLPAGARRGGGGMVGQFGRSRARRVEPNSQTVTFEDVAGIEEAEQELVEVVDFLRNPDRYRKLGARIPRGVLLSGPPGTGKTLLARAVAGEADVPFFSASASEFIEAIVGIGASRVRDLFKQAKEAAPAIVFVDELDAIGRSRGGSGGSLGGHDEREQTLNQILTEMDGFESGAGVIVLGATNRPDVLDPALLRPGRFDRRVAVQPPDSKGREMILRVHTRSVPLDDEVDLEQLAQTTPGMVGADLANLVNEAALLAARREHAEGQARGLHGRAREDRARRRAPDRPERGRPQADRLPRGRPRDRGDAHPGGGPRAQGVDHPARAGSRRDALDPGGGPLQLLRGASFGPRSRWRSVAGWQRRSSTGTPPPAPSRTSSRSRGSPAAWCSAGG